MSEELFSEEVLKKGAFRIECEAAKIEPVVILGVLKEVQAQLKKWGDQKHHQFVWNAILVEEVGEYAKGVLEKNTVNVREELMQIAAVTLSAIRSLDRFGIDGEAES